MNELLAHLVGDYLFQNHWMATKKTTYYDIALIHASLYTIPFIFLTHNLLSLFIIVSTHFLIDRFRLATYWIKLVNNTWYTNSGYTDDVPAFLSVWLIIIIDNTFHLLINHFALLLK